MPKNLELLMAELILLTVLVEERIRQLPSSTLREMLDGILDKLQKQINAHLREDNTHG